MSFDPQAGSSIPLDIAATFTANWRSVRAGNTDAVYLNKNIILQILNQEGCVGLRSYNAINASQQQTLVMVGVDANGNDMVNGIIADYGSLCPPHCNPQSPLNS